MHLISRRGMLAGAVVASIGVMQPEPSCGQAIQYGYTDFLHGFASSGQIWTSSSPFLGQSPAAYLGGSLDLRAIRAPSFPISQDVAQWRSTYVASLQPGGHVIAGHSTGVLLARSTYVLNPDQRSRIRAIIAIAAPHRGTLLADSATKARDYINTMIRRVQRAQTVAQAWKFGPLLPFALAGYITGSTSINLDELQGLPAVPALRDLRPASPLVQLLQDNTLDAAIPRGNVVARIGLRYAPLKVMAALQGVDENGLIQKRLKGEKDLRTCIHAYTATFIGSIGSGAADICRDAYSYLVGLDDAWGRYVNGSELRSFSYRWLQWQRHVARDVPFDGIIANERSQYPGLTDPLLSPAPLDGLNHQNVYKTARGLNTVRDVMQRMGVPPVTLAPPLTVSIGGPDVVPPSQTCSWWATVQNGTPPYQFSWTANGGAIGSDYEVFYRNSGATFTLKVTVTDAGLRTASAQRQVTVSSSTGFCPY